MAEVKTKPNDASVTEFLDRVANERKRQDCYTLVELMRQATGAEPRMWGDSIVGFGGYFHTNSRGKRNEWPLVAFSPRKQSLTLYIMSGFEQENELLGRLGKHTASKACLYVKRLSDMDMAVLRELIELSVAHMTRTNATKEQSNHG